MKTILELLLLAEFPLAAALVWFVLAWRHEPGGGTKQREGNQMNTIWCIVNANGDLTNPSVLECPVDEGDWYRTPGAWWHKSRCFFRELDAHNAYVNALRTERDDIARQISATELEITRIKNELSKL